MNFIFLESIPYPTDDDLLAKAFGDNSEDRRRIMDKYPDKKISFQSSSNYNKQEYSLNVFEIKKREDDRFNRRV